MDTGHSVVRTAVFLFNFSFGVLHIIIDMVAVFFVSVNTCHKFIMPNNPRNIE